MRILFLEDDQEIGTSVTKSLERSGHIVDWLKDGREALVAATTASHEVIILDRTTPGLDCLSVLQAIRASKNPTPVLFLTSMSEVREKVEGLEEGVDDYLAKPFSFSELLARVNALGRRRISNSNEENNILVFDDLELDLVRRRCTISGEVVPLLAKELRLLEAFMQNRGRVLTKSMLLDQVWSINFDPGTNVVETHLSRLRGKIEKPFGKTYIRTIRGTGYVLENQI